MTVAFPLSMVAVIVYSQHVFQFRGCRFKFEFRTQCLIKMGCRRAHFLPRPEAGVEALNFFLNSSKLWQGMDNVTIFSRSKAGMPSELFKNKINKQFHI